MSWSLTSLNNNIIITLCREKTVKKEISEIVASMSFLNGPSDYLVKKNWVVKQELSKLKQKVELLSSSHDTRINLLENTVEE